MRIVSSVSDLRRTLGGLRDDNGAVEGMGIGFVPTMGYLHEGHESLIRQAKIENDHVVVSLFVNPLQFAQTEDLGTYPRDPAGDAAKAEAAGATLLFIPEVDEMYPDGRDGVLTTVGVPALASVMEGASRPTHFAGVCTVVAKLFNLIGPCSAYFGEKDYQQLAIIKQMTKDLSIPVEVVGCPTVRERDGLAMSSRNVYLSEAERAAAPVLNRALQVGAEMIIAGETNRDRVLRAMTDEVATEPLATLDYLEIANPATLAPLDLVSSEGHLFGAIRFARARLIDNIAITATDTIAGANGA